MRWALFFSGVVAAAVAFAAPERAGVAIFCLVVVCVVELAFWKEIK